MSADLLARPGVDQAARWLELHPFEVVRILAVAGELPADLRVDGALAERVAELGGVQAWWTRPPMPEDGETPATALLRALCGHLLAHAVVEPAWTRADNLFRGLDADVQPLLRRAVNGLIRDGWLAARMAASGLVVTVRLERVDALRAFAAQGDGPLAALAEGV